MTATQVAARPRRTTVRPAPAAAEDSLRRLPLGALTLVGGNFFVAIGFGMIGPALPALAVHFDSSAVAVSAVIVIYSAMRLAFAPLCGTLAHRFGESRQYFLGACLVGVSAMLFGFAPNYPSLLGLRAVSGIGSIMYTVSASTLLIRLAPPHMRGRVSGLSHTTFLLGYMIGPALGGLLVGYSLPAPFVIYGLLMIGVGACGRVLLAGQRPGREAPASGRAATPALRIRDVWRRPLFVAVLASGFVLGWEVYGVRLSLVPLYAIEHLRQSPAVAGFGLTLSAVGSAAVVFLAGRWADRRGRRVVMVSGLTLCGAALTAMGTAPFVLAFLLLSLLVGVGAGVTQPAQGASLADLVGNRASGGRVVAAVSMAVDTGSMVGPLAAGLIADRFGLGSALMLSGALMVVPVAVWLTLPAGTPKP